MQFTITIEQVNDDNDFSLTIDGKEIVSAERATEVLHELRTTIERAMRNEFDI